MSCRTHSYTLVCKCDSLCLNASPLDSYLQRPRVNVEYRDSRMDPFGMPPGGGMGAPMPGAMSGAGGDPYAGVQTRKGYASWAVFFFLGRKTHSFVCFTFLGASALLQSLVTLGAPFIKQMYFVEGVLMSEVSHGSNTWTPALPIARGPELLARGKRVASLRIGWLGSCLYDHSTGLSLCDVNVGFPIVLSTFSLPEAAGISGILGSGAARALMANAAGAGLTFAAVFAHRLLRLRGPFFVSVAASVLTWIAFIMDVSLFLNASQAINTKTAGLVGCTGPSIMFEGIAAGLVALGTWMSYSRSVKAELGWPKKDPHPSKPEAPAGGGEAAAMAGAPPPMGDPMAGMGAPPPMPGAGAPPMGGDPFAMPGGAPPGPPGM